jgi:hypothetical protein
VRDTGNQYSGIFVRIHPSSWVTLPRTITH